MNRRRSSVSTTIPLTIDLTDIITPKSCSLLIAELIKYIAYIKQQIPFPYQRLKMYVLKRREKLKSLQFSSSEQESESHLPNRDQLIMEKYFKKVEDAFEILESTFKCIEQKLVESCEYPLDEIVVLFGATPISPKDMYRIAIPPLTHNHSESQHFWKNQIANMFRGIIISEELHNNLQRRVGLTNMFVMFKVKNGIDSRWVLPKDRYRLSSTAHQVCFSFTSKPAKTCMCEVGVHPLNRITHKMANLNVSEEHILCNYEASYEKYEWFQNDRTLKGFKDSKRHGKSVADLWYKHRFFI